MSCCGRRLHAEVPSGAGGATLAAPSFERCPGRAARALDDADAAPLAEGVVDLVVQVATADDPLGAVHEAGVAAGAVTAREAALRLVDVGEAEVDLVEAREAFLHRQRGGLGRGAAFEVVEANVGDRHRPGAVGAFEDLDAEQVRARFPVFDLGVMGPPKRPDDDGFWEEPTQELLGGVWTPDAWPSTFTRLS